MRLTPRGTCPGPQEAPAAERCGASVGAMATAFASGDAPQQSLGELKAAVGGDSPRSKEAAREADVDSVLSDMMSEVQMDE